mgnify:FL=1|tara:strand:- start:1248 stop:1628 length:381 start_codon:yes stop_codon:yes gene_type:complete
MENPRVLLNNHIHSIKGYTDDNKRWDNYIVSSIIEGINYTIMDYINIYRNVNGNENGKIMSNLEKEYYLCDEDFIDTQYPEFYIESNRAFHEKGLIMYIYDNFHKIESTKHRRIMFYFMNILHFGL